jgi:hypothetical protein
VLAFLQGFGSHKYALISLRGGGVFVYMVARM